MQQAFYDTIEQQRMAKVAEDILKERQLTLRQAAAFQRAELGSKLDSTMAEVNAANAGLELLQARDRLRTAFAELNHAMGIVGEPAYALEEPQVIVPLPAALETCFPKGDFGAHAHRLPQPTSEHPLHARRAISRSHPAPAGGNAYR